MCLSTLRKKISADKSKQTSTFLEIRDSNKSTFEMHDLSFKHLLPYLSLLINGLLEMWLGLLTFYVWSLKGKQKIFLSSSLECRQKIVLRLVIL